jgi:secondary thiamine-phosphate synthase enzyme
MPAAASAAVVAHRILAVETQRRVEFVDITPLLARTVREAGLVAGMAMVQTRHTTTGLLVNEHEPLLVTDLEAFFTRVATAPGGYAHDDFSRRMVNLTPNERKNGHAHCCASLLRTSECVAVVNGALDLGRWQRVFLVEFDGAQRRELSVTLIGDSCSAGL